MLKFNKHLIILANEKVMIIYKIVSYDLINILNYTQ
jgi:hypothetical protein